MEDVANESSIATFQSKADVTCRGYKGEEVNLVATIMAMLFWLKQTMPATKQASQDRKLDEAVVTDGGKQQLIIQEKVDVDKPSLVEDVITHHDAIENTTDKVTKSTDKQVAEKEEEKLVTEGLTEEFHEIDEFTRLGTLRELSRHEIDSWVGPSNYVSIQHVRKPTCKTPRMQFVFDFSLKCPKTGLSLKDMMTKGMNVLGNIWELLWFMGNRDR